MMNQRALAVVILFFVIVVGGMFGYAYLKNKQMRDTIIVPPAPTERPMGVTRVDAKHFFKDGVHTVAGEIMMPTPCDLLEADPVIQEGTPERVTIAFSVINNTSGVCAQVQTPQRFKTSFNASEGAFISATFKGEPVILNLVDAGPDENPDDFELFIKG